MTTPNKAEMLEKAIELYRKYQIQCGAPELAQNTPEEHELKEDGFWSAAVSDLMSSPYKRFEEFEEKKEKEKPERLQPENFADILDVDAVLRSGLVVFGGSGCGKSTLCKAIVRKLAEKGIVCYVVDTSMTWLKEPYDVVQVSRNCKNYTWRFKNTIFDCAELTVNENTIFVDSLARSLLDVHMTNTAGRSEILVLEEAELYMSNNSLRSKRLENLLTFISSGRNFGLRTIAISQVPSMVDKLPIKLSEQRFFGRLSEPNDQRYCKMLLGKETVEQLKSLTVGNFISENKGMIQRFKLDIEKPRGWSQVSFACQYAVL